MKILNKYHRLIALAILSASSTGAMAHPGHETIQGFASGLQHPFFGLDHLVTMIALGFIATRLGARMATLVTFSLGMLSGGLMAFAGITIPYAELLIVTSLVAVALVLFNNRQQSFRLAYAIPLIALFASCHGWAHVAEQPTDLSSLWYMIGIMSGALTLQLAGLGLSTWLRHKAAAGKTMAGAALTTAAVTSVSLLLG